MPRRFLSHPLTYICVALAAFFYKEIFLGLVFSPADYLFGTPPWSTLRPAGWHRPLNGFRTDEVMIFFPRMLATGRDLREHGVSLWQSHALVGSENTLSLHFLGALVWPPMWTFSFLPPALANTVFHLPILLVAALSMYVLTGELTTNHWTRGLASLVWGFNGYFVVWLSAFSLPLTLAVLPLMVYLSIAFIGSGNWWKGLQYSLLLGWTFYLAYPPANIVLIACLVVMVGAYVSGALRARAARAALWGGLSLLGTGIGALPILTQAVELRSQAAGGYRVILGALPSWSIPDLLLPNLYGNPVSADWVPAIPRIDINFLELTGYIGVLTLALALAGALLAISHRRWWASAGLLLAMFGFAMAYASGPAAAMAAIPILSAVRPARWLIAFDFGALLLATHAVNIGLHSLRGRLICLGSVTATLMVAVGIFLGHRHSMSPASIADAELRIVGLVGSTLAFVVFVGRRTRVAWVPVLFAITAVDLITFGVNFNPAIPVAEFYPTTPALSYLSAHSHGYRTLVANPDEMLYGGDVLNVYGIASLTGYDHFRHADLISLLGDSVDPWEKLEWSVWGFLELGPTVNYSNPALDELAVRYAFIPFGGADLPRPPAPQWALRYSGDDGSIYENSAVLPMVFAVPPTGVAAALNHSPASPDHDSLVITGPTVLTWSQPADRGWHLKIDGRPIKVTRYRDYFLAASVPPGRHVVAADFMPRDYAVGAPLTAMFLCLWAASAMAVWIVRLRRKAGSGSSALPRSNGPARWRREGH